MTQTLAQMKPILAATTRGKIRYLPSSPLPVPSNERLGSCVQFDRSNLGTPSSCRDLLTHRALPQLEREPLARVLTLWVGQRWITKLWGISFLAWIARNKIEPKHGVSIHRLLLWNVVFPVRFWIKPPQLSSCERLKGSNQTLAGW